MLKIFGFFQATFKAAFFSAVVVLAFHLGFANAPFAFAQDAVPNLRFSYAFPYEFTYDFCRANDPLGVTVPIDRAGNFYKKCAPDTLYSWQDEAKVVEWLKESTPSNILPISYLYTWRTPIGTFAYGKVGVRIKLRRNTFFIRIDRPIHYDPNCNQLAREFGPNAPNVYIKVHDYEGAPRSISEYLICSTAPVESWSVGQPLFLEEMEREIEWIQTHTHDKYDLYIPLQGPVPWKNTTIDAGWFADPWTEKTLLDRLEDTHTRTPEIRFRADAIQSLEDHFATNTPVYFNPGMPRPALVAPSPIIEIPEEITPTATVAVKKYRRPHRHYTVKKNPAPPLKIKLPPFSWNFFLDSFQDSWKDFFKNLFPQPPESKLKGSPHDSTR